MGGHSLVVTSLLIHTVPAWAASWAVTQSLSTGLTRSSTLASTPVLRSSTPVLRSLTEDSIERITEIVLHDAQMVFRTAQDKPVAALALARKSAQYRLPIVTWLVEYKAEQKKLWALERTIEAARLMIPCAVDELDAQVLNTNMKLCWHKARLRAALKDLTPVVKQRLLQAARERPSKIPSISFKLLRSGVYKLRWRFNTLVAPLRSQEAYEKTRAKLVEKWLARLLELHRMANQHTTCIDIFMQMTRQVQQASRGVRRCLSGQRSAAAVAVTSSQLATMWESQMSVFSWAVATRVANSARLHTWVLWLATRRLVCLIILGAQQLSSGTWLRVLKRYAPPRHSLMLTSQVTDL